MKIKYFTMLILVFFLYSCEEEKLDIEKYGTISGIILDGESYTPLSGVQVATNPASTTVLTNDLGVFKINKVKEGDVAITARKKNYLGNTINVAVYADEQTDLTFFLLIDENNVGWVMLYDPVPGNGAINQNTNLTLKWNVDQENKGKSLDYTVYYYESNSLTQKIAGENLINREVTITGLSSNTTYYWFVVAKYEGNRVANSPTWTFKTGTNEN